MHAPVATNVASKVALNKSVGSTVTTTTTSFTTAAAATSNTTMTNSTAVTTNNDKQKLQQKGHCRSSSLENSNTIFPSIPSSKSAMFPSGVSAGFSGTLKSQREQKRIHDYLRRQEQQQPQELLSGGGGLDHSRRQHFKNIREIFEKTRGKVNQSTSGSVGGGQAMLLSRSQRDLNQIIPTRDTDEQPMTQQNSTDVDKSVVDSDSSTPPKIQSCSGVLNKGPKEVIRPIAFKPVPYRPSNYSRLTNELAERYGSTPSLVTGIDSHHRFSSTNDLNQNVYNNYGMLYRKHQAQQQQQQHLHHHHHHYSSNIPFKTYDSLESILRLPNSVTPTQSIRLVQYIVFLF